ncbi:MAG: metal-dependent transcriptional regulator [Acidobacteriota bacterium]
MPTSTVEDYLKCIYLAQHESPGSLVATGYIASLLEVAPGTVTAMVKALAESGLVDYEPYNGVQLSDAGEKLAAHVLRRHRLVELFLVQIMGIDWSDVHGEAERLEHAVSDSLIERMDEMLGKPEVDPHGDPIPSVSGLVQEIHYPNLVNCQLDESLKVVRVTDQGKDFLRLVQRYGLMPGKALRVMSRDPQADTVSLRPEEGGSVDLGFRAAAKILVSP